ncbi:putative protein phosphatase 2C-type [mine drainage metagenome]|uniref:PPM-type phosphatase domain-containing protein n=1 Tax=mine drainage metagenome TaxID=410659 RepID=A0A1J5Q3X5_9ZZZZ
MKPALQLQAASGTHRGDREYQQDRVAILAHPRVRGLLLALVADGMGGRSGGRMASDQLVMTAQQLFDGHAPQQRTPRELLHAIQRESHLMIRLNAISSEQEPHSTWAGVLLEPDGQCHWAHVGDSRVHVIRDGELLRRTSDHSYVQQLVDDGKLSAGAARNHTMSNVLTASLGMPDDPPFVADTVALQAGDSVMLCSDGLWHYFTDQDLEIATSKLQPRECCQYLIDKARTRAGGRGDNLSLIVIELARLPAPGETSSTSSGA